MSVQVPATKIVSVAGDLSAGGIWSDTSSDATGDFTFREMLDFLYAQEARKCVPLPGFTVCKEDQTQGEPVELPARGAAICQSADDWNALKTALEVVCRQVGKRCSYEVRRFMMSANPVKERK